MHRVEQSAPFLFWRSTLEYVASKSAATSFSSAAICLLGVFLTFRYHRLHLSLVTNSMPFSPHISSHTNAMHFLTLPHSGVPRARILVEYKVYVHCISVSVFSIYTLPVSIVLEPALRFRIFSGPLLPRTSMSPVLHSHYCKKVVSISFEATRGLWLHCASNMKHSFLLRGSILAPIDSIPFATLVMCAPLHGLVHSSVGMNIHRLVHAMFERLSSWRG